MVTRSNEPAQPRLDPADDHRGSGAAMVRSEERLRVGTAVRVTGRAVLRKYVVTETVTQTFQVRHEEVRLEHEPLSGDAGPDAMAPAGDEPVVEVVLHREVPVVQLRVEAVERVRLHIDTITTHVEVSEQLRSEQLTVEAPEHLTVPPTRAAGA